MRKGLRIWSAVLVLLMGGFNGKAQTKIREHRNLDENWLFHFGHASNPEKDFNYSLSTIFSKSGGPVGTAFDPRLKDSSWKKIDLPHDWVVELPFVKDASAEVESHGYKPVGGRYPATSIGWYRKHFKVSTEDSGSRFQIQFDGIYRNASVWVNGLYVGNNFSGYMGVSYDVTDFLRYGADNVIAIRVDATQYEGWFYEGAGIYRHVWLNKYNNVHVNEGGVFTTAVVQENKATVTVQTHLENQSQDAVNCNVTVYIKDQAGNIITQSKEQSLSLTVNAKGKTLHNLQIKDPRLWTLEDPYRYRVVAVVKSGTKVVDEVEDRFGIRTFRFDGARGFFLNGKHVKIYGTNNHQDHAGVGSALPDGLQYYRIGLLKEMGVNAYRTSHNPPTPELLEACDSLGVLVLDEHRLLNSGKEYIDQLERLILRDRNHPSVFLWSIGNEEGWIHATNTGKNIAMTLLAKQQELDPSRTSTYAADLGNVFKGVNEVIPVRGFNYRQFAVADYHRDHPDQPILGTEMGSTVTTRGEYTKDSIRGYVPDQDITAPWWASTAETWWKLAAENDYWMGGFVWTGFDYRGEPTPFTWPNINSHFGIMDMCGFPKNIYYYYQSWWTNKDVLHISPHWNWKNKTGEAIDVWVNSNAADVELFLNGKSLGKKNMPVNGHLQWNVQYQPGKLEAVANKNGRVLKSSVETTGAPYKIVILPSKTRLKADGKDISVLNFTVLDEQGREVPDADNLLQFEVKGAGKIIGVGNGDPSSHEPDQCVEGAWQRHLFNGKAQVILQSSKSAGAIQFKVYSKGLLGAEFRLENAIFIP